jgi:phosphotransferase system enzyme I (PtsI)
VLRLIVGVVAAARAARIPVACCGEVGSTPAGFIRLLGLGIRDFSMNVFAIPQLKQIARMVSLGDAERVAREALAATTTDEVRRIVEAHARPILNRL